MRPERDQIWVNKKTKREARVLAVNANPIFGMEYKYRTSNPESRAKHMTRHRRNTVYASVASFTERFEFVREATPKAV